jgi:hypothetical protein
VSQKTKYILAGVAFLVAVGLYLLAPLDILIPLAWAGLVIGGAGAYGVHKWLERLAKAGRIDDPGRRHFWEEVGLGFAIVALMAALILIFEYGD